MIDIQFYCQWYENYNGLSTIQDFIAHWAIINKEMVNVSKCDSVWMKDALIYNEGIEFKFYRFTICLFSSQSEL